MGGGIKVLHFIIKMGILYNVITLVILETCLLPIQKNNIYLANVSFIVQENTLMQQCVILCMEFPVCVSLSLSLNTLQCRLNYVTGEDFPELIKKEEGQIYMEKKEFTTIFKDNIHQINCSINMRYFPRLKLCLPYGFGPVTNIAVNKKTTLSSTLTYYGFTLKSEFAADGNWGTHGYDDGCAHSDQEQNPWWMVDLQHPYIIKKVVIANRGDQHWDWFRNVKVLVGQNATSFEICGTFHGPGTSGQIVDITCGIPIIGEFVKIVFEYYCYLALCEVGVFAYHFPSAN